MKQTAAAIIILAGAVLCHAGLTATKGDADLATLVGLILGIFGLFKYVTVSESSRVDE